ncbi:type I-E CRISPR-associated endonuclease Cas1e [Nocardiopsis sp. SBT366]|uniref:type I-E CRISPR-associated endonuclease Cas1e n=1 Tax=Nocardiopsis sp. SBT366 TaxID=1580529 RepID=UPI00066E5F80|nr:type I-E CRISPR-associated endonuclease Cas1e [Nocardiopsis sp. SBT366]
MSKNARHRLAAPTVAMLPRIADSLSFLYLDIVRVYQDDTGICAQVETEERGKELVYLPTAALSCVLLGPGTSITARALTAFARHGTTVLISGSGGVRTYSAMVPSSLSTTWLEHQVRAWADDTERLAVAKRMYERRFGPGVVAGDKNVAQLRGMEGQRVRALYRLFAQQYKLARFKRSYDPEDWDEQDPVNRALSSANTCLYGIVHAAVVALGCSPALGFIHSGNQQAFIYDVADLYKAELTIPLAFSLHASSNPEQRARVQFREELRLFALLPRIVADIQLLLRPQADVTTPDLEEQVVDLWDPISGSVPGAINHSSDQW